MLILNTGAAEPAAGSSGKKTRISPVPQAFVSDKIVQFFSRKTGQELMDEKKAASSKANITKSAKKPQDLPPRAGPSVPKAREGYVPPAPPAATPPQVTQIRQEVQRILELNAKVKSLQGDQTAQLQRIQEQARIHQRVLDQLEASQSLQDSRKAPSKEALLAQEKLRIIHEETIRNRDILNGKPSDSQPVTARAIQPSQESSSLRN
jgi:hypothetical protein